MIDDNNFENSDAAAATVAITVSNSGTFNSTVTSNAFDNLSTGRGFTQTSVSGTVRLDLNDNTANNVGALQEYVLTETGGTFTVVDLATVDARNTGDSADPVLVGAGIADDPDPVPLPIP